MAEKKKVEKLTEEQRDLVMSHYDYIKRVVDRHVSYIPSEAIWNIEDAYQIGFLAACEAARTYNPHRGSFATFASKCIMSKLGRLFTETGRYVRVFDIYTSVDDLLEALEKQRLVPHGINPYSSTGNADANIAKHFADTITSQCLENYRNAETRFEMNFEVRQILADPDVSDFDKLCVDIAYRYSSGWTLVELGEEFGITKQGACARKERGLKILERRLASS